MRLSDRQTGQGRNSGKLQPPQTRALSGFAAWHCGHRILVIPHCRYFSVQPPAGCHKRPNASRSFPRGGRHRAGRFGCLL